jgi:hypothetical protein
MSAGGWPALSSAARPPADTSAHECLQLCVDAVLRSHELEPAGERAPAGWRQQAGGTFLPLVYDFEGARVAVRSLVMFETVVLHVTSSDPSVASSQLALVSTDYVHEMGTCELHAGVCAFGDLHAIAYQRLADKLRVHVVHKLRNAATNQTPHLVGLPQASLVHALRFLSPTELALASRAGRALRAARDSPQLRALRIADTPPGARSDGDWQEWRRLLRDMAEAEARHQWWWPRELVPWRGWMGLHHCGHEFDYGSAQPRAPLHVPLRVCRAGGDGQGQGAHAHAVRPPGLGPGDLPGFWL